MTEQEWLACAEPQKILEFVQGKASDRKLRLWACACARRLWHLLADDPNRRAVEVAERYADGQATLGELNRARRTIVRASRLGAEANELLAWRSAAYLAWCTTRKQAAPAARDAAGAAAWYAVARPGSSVPGNIGWKMEGDFHAEWRWQADVLRDLFGNPFRPVSVKLAWLAWNEGTIPKLAQAVYEERAFERLPLLADALEEAGCDSAEVLAHCRGPGPHARGRWAVDLLLQKK